MNSVESDLFSKETPGNSEQILKILLVWTVCGPNLVSCAFRQAPRWCTVDLRDGNQVQRWAVANQQPMWMACPGFDQPHEPRKEVLN